MQGIPQRHRGVNEMCPVCRVTHIGIAAAPCHGDRPRDAFVLFARSGDHSRPDLNRTKGAGRGLFRRLQF